MAKDGTSGVRATNNGRRFENIKPRLDKIDKTQDVHYTLLAFIFEVICDLQGWALARIDDHSNHNDLGADDLPFDGEQEQVNKDFFDFFRRYIRLSQFETKRDTIF